jgi:hypothetical protein
MLRGTHHRRLLAAVATTAALAATAPAASAMPVDNGGGASATSPAPEPERVRVVRVQVDQGLDWGDAGVGAAGMLALVLIGYGGAHALTTVPGREQSATRS